MNETDRRQTIFSALRYTDAWAALTFLEQGFGFERQSMHEGPGHTVAHAELRLGTASVGLSSATGPADGNPWTTVRTGIYAALPDAASVDAHHATAVAAGAEIARALQDTDYGAREYSVWDHERHLWSFGTYSHAVPGEPSLFVEVRYRAGGAAVAWLRQAFGFVPGLQVPGDDGRLVHAELQLGDSVLMVNDAVAAPGHDRQAQHVCVANPDAHHARAVRAGATIVHPLADTSYGARGYCALDPEGFLWGFSTYRPALV